MELESYQWDRIEVGSFGEDTRSPTILQLGESHHDFHSRILVYTLRNRVSALWLNSSVERLGPFL